MVSFRFKIFPDLWSKLWVSFWVTWHVYQYCVACWNLNAACSQGPLLKTENLYTKHTAPQGAHLPTNAPKLKMQQWSKWKKKKMPKSEIVILVNVLLVKKEPSDLYGGCRRFNKKVCIRLLMKRKNLLVLWMCVHYTMGKIVCIYAIVKTNYPSCFPK